MMYLLVATYDWRRRPGAPNPGVRCSVLMPTLEQAKKVHGKLLEDELGPMGEWGFLGGVLNKTDWRVSFPGGSWIQFVSAERIDNARGIRCDFGGFDEADDIDTEAADAVAVPWFSEPHSLKMRLIGGTPRRGRYGLLYRTLARAQGKMLKPSGERFTNHHGFHASCYEFPEFVDADAIQTALDELPPDIFKREWLCDFDAAEGLVYSIFDSEFHVREPHPDTLFHTYLVGGDVGWEDPGALYEIGITGHGADATAWVLSEVYETHKDEDWWVAQALKITRAVPDAGWYTDPSRPDRAAAYKRKAGATIREVDNAIEDGVGVVANLLVKRDCPAGKRARLYVSKNCPNLIREFGRYRRRRDPRNSERVLDDILDKDNHACFVAGTMVATENGQQAIETIEPGTKVWTRGGLRPVVGSGPTRKAPIWRVELSNGTAIDATADHKFFTAERGRIQLRDLTERDALFAAKFEQDIIVAKVSSLGREDVVYCLAVDVDHEFYAGGVLVANCDAIRYPLFAYFRSDKAGPVEDVETVGDAWG